MKDGIARSTLTLKCRHNGYCNKKVVVQSDHILNVKEIKKEIKAHGWESIGNQYKNLAWYCPEHTPIKKYEVGLIGEPVRLQVEAISKNIARSMFTKSNPWARYIDTFAVEVGE